MPAEHPPRRDPPSNSDDEEREEDEEADEEEDEEEVEEWTELTPLSEVAELEDGPSTHFVGGFSVCHHLGDAITRVQFREDVVLVFPGTYAAAAASASATDAPLELNEARLGGLCVYGVPYALERAAHAGRPHRADPRYAAPSKRRVGPWFAGITAAATAAFLIQEGGGGGGGNAAEPATATKAYHPLHAAASRAAASAPTTTSGSSVFAPAITATTADPLLYPVLDFAVSVVYNDAGTADSTARGLPSYVQQQEADDDGGDGEDGDEEASEAAGGGGGGDADEGEEEHATGNGGRGTGAPREEVAITLAGLCARAGLTLGAITRTHLTHCVVGSPQPQPHAPGTAGAALRIAITAAPLTEALVDYCVVYGGSAYGVYAYPRCALTMRSCIVEGPNAGAAAYNTSGTSALSSAVAGRGGGGGSAIAQLQQRHARTQRLRRYMEQFEGGQDEDAGESSGGGGAAPDVEDGVLARFCVPGADRAAAAAVSMSCEVAIMCDDADVRLSDCLITHTRHGVLLHGGCAGSVVRCVSVRSVAEVGFYVYGMAGAADVQYCAAQACGQTCLLVVGPTAAQVMEAEATLPSRGGDAGEDGTADEDVEEEEDGPDGATGRRRPLFAQHPHIRANRFVGAVRVAGEVRSGAIVDNLVFLPREEQEQAAAAAASLVAVNADASRGFLYVGVEGEKAPSRAADQVSAS
ncbi:hypothetical protein NESM_000354300 [Novymonas esmeraldas]|uniref:Uncharacterized protein n=1 Tax=Novymonas esmeraldas TaxID=1808958 RepID=A0AAW0EJN6_9TRYP